MLAQNIGCSVEKPLNNELNNTRARYRASHKYHAQKSDSKYTLAGTKSSGIIYPSPNQVLQDFRH
jgi:hypothetical protein